MEAQFLLVQLVTFHRSNNPHHSPRQQQRIAELHRRLDVIERQLRMRAAELGDDTKGTLGELRRTLVDKVDRRKGADPHYFGPERRKAQRRKTPTR
jgi:type II secretory pathway component PulJ